ncbi:MAG: hypothetical protein LIP08_00110, partial [Bacteroides sp.]|nr:hypothetical protein [Bacteroides sp.]
MIFTNENKTNLYVGDNSISHVYVGDELVYQKKEVVPYTIEFTVSDGNTARLNVFSSAEGMTIDWGDGTIETTSEAYPAHTYITGGVYYASVKGRQLVLRANSLSPIERNCITGVVSWGNSISDMQDAFYNCNKLSYIPDDKYGAFKETKEFYSCFNACLSLTSVPEEIFSYSTEATNFQNCFNNCSSLTVIPEKLFINNKKVTNFVNCFNYCRSLRSIPEKLFNNNIEVRDFQSCFSHCISLA